MERTLKIANVYSTEDIKVKKVGNITRIRMSAGGGVGGACWYEYGEVTGNPKTDKMIELKNPFSGQTRLINTAFIVTLEEKSLWNVQREYMFNNAKKKRDAFYWLNNDETLSVENGETIRDFEDERFIVSHNTDGTDMRTNTHRWTVV